MVNTNRESGKANGTPLRSLHMNEEITGKSSALGRYRIYFLPRRHSLCGSLYSLIWYRLQMGNVELHLYEE